MPLILRSKSACIAYTRQEWAENNRILNELQNEPDLLGENIATLGGWFEL